MIVEHKKPRIMIWALVACIVIGIFILIGTIWDIANIPTTPTTILWLVTVVTLLIFGLILMGSGEKKERPTIAPSGHHAAPAAAHAPAGAHAAGHGDHHGPDPWAFAKWSVGAGIFIGACLLGALGLFLLLQTGSKQVRVQAGAQAPAGYSARQDDVSTDWVPIAAPVDDWLTVNGKAGYNIYVCVPSTDPNCTAPEPIGFRMRCVLMDGMTEVDWDTSGSCRNYLRLKLQATGENPLPMNYRYVAR